MTLDLYDKHQFGSHYKNLQDKFETIIGMLSYINDNNISNNGAPHESIVEVIRKIQPDAQLWNNIFKSTGGTLNLLKCFFQAINYYFAQKGPPVVALTNPD